MHVCMQLYACMQFYACMYIMQCMYVCMCMLYCYIYIHTYTRGLSIMNTADRPLARLQEPSVRLCGARAVWFEVKVEKGVESTISQSSLPMGPCSCMVYIWALK